MTKISIIVPFYNTNPNYFKKCMQSLLNQTYEDIEIIVINDGSSEIYKKQLEEYRENARVNIVHTSNNGVSEARNLGLSIASGDYIIFVDSDDWIEINACELIAKEITKSLADIIVTSCLVNSGGERTCSQQPLNLPFYINDKQLLYDAIFKNVKSKYTCVDTPWAKVYRREFLIENNLKFNKNLKNGEDGLFNFECYYKAEKIYYSNVIFYNYYVNSESTCNKFSKDLCERFLVLLTEYSKLFNHYNLIKETRYFEYFVMRIICRLLRKYFSKIKKYKTFKKEFSLFVKEKIIADAFRKVKIRDLEKGKKLVYLLCKLKWKFLLFKIITKTKINLR